MAEERTPSAEAVAQETGELPAISGRTTRRRPGRKTTAHVVAEGEPEPAFEAAVPIEPPAEEEVKKSPTYRRRMTRQKAEEITLPEPVAEAAETEATQAEEETGQTSTTEAIGEEKLLAQRRRGRGRKAVEKEEAEQQAAPIVHEAAESGAPVSPTPEETEGPQPEAPPARPRRAPRKKVETMEPPRGAKLVTRWGMVEIQID
ncbi:MAG TPA: hypothetical protein VNJ09_08940, partial [Chthonomonadales bacterium]|nr:hypothetical protein [Chthonomonadales bacterium]